MVFASLLVGHNALGSGNDGDAQTLENLGQLIGAGVDTQAGLGNALQPGQGRLLLAQILQGDVNDALIAVVLQREGLDVALIQQNLGNGLLQVLRVARTTDSLLMTMLSSFLLLGGLVCVIFVIEFFLVQNQTQKLIEPINQINLEKPLDNVCYEELRPLLFRLDQQNRQIKKQMEDLKNAERNSQEKQWKV